MKKFFLLLVLAAGSLLATGCDPDDWTVNRGNGMVEDSNERSRRLSLCTDILNRQLIDDIDEFWLFDQNIHLTEWDVRVGH